MVKLALVTAILVFGSGLPTHAVAGPGETSRPAEKPLSNADVLDLVRLGLSEAVIVAKIKQAADVSFNLDTEGLVALKKGGAGSSVIEAMLERSTSDRPMRTDAERVRVMLVTADGEFELDGVGGTIGSIVAPFVGYRRYVAYQGAHSDVKTSDRRPSVSIASDDNPSGRYWLVRLDVDTDDDDRGLDLKSPGAWGGEISEAPEAEDIVASDVAAGANGSWIFTPRKDLSPGEYGLHALDHELFGFGVEKTPRKKSN